MVATFPGLVAPDEIYVVGAHYDSVGSGLDPGVPAPGADDNGSGTAGLLEIARIVGARRAYLKGGNKGPFLYMLVPMLADLMKDVYPELAEKREHISAIINEEEKRFYSMHHPFTSPNSQHIEFLDKIIPDNVEKIRAQAYDALANVMSELLDE